MEIKLNAGANLVIPDGCKATIKDNLVLIEKIEPEFKRYLIRSFFLKLLNFVKISATK